MAFFRIAPGTGARFTTTGDEIDVVPSSLADFDIDDVPFTKDGSTLVFDFSGRGAIGGSPLGDVVAVFSGRRLSDFEIRDEDGALLVEAEEFPITPDFDSFFPFNHENDKIAGAELADQIDAGLGDDVVIGAGADRLLGGAGADRLVGGVGDDTIRGGRDGDDIHGGDGADKLKGGGGGDMVIGGGGADSLNGGAGADTFKGGAGADRLAGDKGDDLLISGGGFDVFVFAANGGRDVVQDFTQGRDLIEIRSGADDFDDLVIRQRGDDVRIRFAETAVLFEDEDRADFTAADFIF